MEIKILSSLAKVFPDEICGGYEIDSLSCLKNEKAAFQIAVRAQDDSSFSACSDCRELKIYKVNFVPAEYAASDKRDSYYIRDGKKGLYPDVLIPFDGETMLKKGEWTSLWCEFCPDNKISGEYEIKIKLKTEKSEDEVSVKAEIADAVFGKQEIICTHWFHSDCLATHYGVEIFSEEYWRIVESFMKTAREHGVNFILTPLFTPPLDTEVGGERPTVQLVDVKRDSYQYTFGFDKLKRWIETAFRCGMEYIEFSHLYTQWGASHAPKIMAETRDGYKRIFGWETNAHGKRYESFLRQLAPELIKFIDEMGIREKCMFHTSDEPSLKDYFKYRKSARLMNELFGEFKIIDALSNFAYYKNGLIKNPIPGIEHMEDFAGRVPELWTYYCCGPDDGNYINRFNAMPSVRNRILGFVMYKYGVKGFLHWGYNFYYTQHSKSVINPFEVTDAGGNFPSGDSFVVYPAEDGTAYVSLRFKVFYEAIQDYEALLLLEKKIGREETLKILEEGLEKPLRANEYPHSEQWIIEKRKEINSKL